MENKFLGIRASQKSYPIKKFVWHLFCFLSPNARIHEKASRTARVGKSFFKALAIKAPICPNDWAKLAVRFLRRRKKTCAMVRRMLLYCHRESGGTRDYNSFEIFSIESLAASDFFKNSETFSEASFKSFSKRLSKIPRRDWSILFVVWAV